MGFIDVNIMVIIVLPLMIRIAYLQPKILFKGKAGYDKNGFYLYYIMLIVVNIDFNIANKMYIQFGGQWYLI
jgi:hypothetical protein